jgi:CheY-like chemotaxis protein
MPNTRKILIVDDDPEMRDALRASIDEPEACFIVRDTNGQALAYVYFEGEIEHRSAAHLLTSDEARRIAANIAKLRAAAQVVASYQKTTSGLLWPGALPDPA